MEVSTPWVRASMDVASAPAWMVVHVPLVNAASTVAAISDGGTASVRN
ncbi:MAG: hypothetical protein ACHRXM_06465 [Isosphaerales bacterium]